MDLRVSVTGGDQSLQLFKVAMILAWVHGIRGNTKFYFVTLYPFGLSVQFYGVVITPRSSQQNPNEKMFNHRSNKYAAYL